MSKPMYRIKIEVIGEEDECKLDQTDLKPIECDGFAILGSKDDKPNSVFIHHLSTIDIANIIAEHDTLLSASIIAKAFKEAFNMKHSALNQPSKDLLARILGL